MWPQEPDPHADGAWIAQWLTSRLVVAFFVALVALVALAPPPSPPEVAPIPHGGCGPYLVFPSDAPPPPPPPRVPTPR